MKKGNYFFKDGNRKIYFNPEDIIFGKQNSNYLDIHFINNTKASYYGSIKDFLKQFTLPHNFFHCNRSYLVNLDEVRNLDNVKSKLVMSDKTDVDITKKEIAAFEEAMNCIEIK